MHKHILVSVTTLEVAKDQSATAPRIEQHAGKDADALKTVLEGSQVALADSGLKND